MIRFKKDSFKILELTVSKKDYEKLKYYVETNYPEYYIFDFFFDVPVKLIDNNDSTRLFGIPRKDIEDFRYLRVKQG